MRNSSDGRIPIAFIASVAQAKGEAFLVEGNASVPPGTVVERFSARVQRHAFGCVCCRSRSPAAQALSRLSVAYAKGAINTGVLVYAATEEGRASVSAALKDDVVLQARFRLTP